jgi:hypothetical protein
MEVGVAGVNERNETLLLGECKWTADAVARGLLADLEAIEPDVRWHGSDRSVVYALFSRSGFTPDLQEATAERDDVHLFTAADLMALF